MQQYARYRAPAESGQKLVSPPWSELGEIAAANRAWRVGADLAIGGQPLQEFAADARRELLARAAEYVATYHPARVEASSNALDDGPLFLTGHQPEMVHPGVWLKNFAAGSLAKAYGGRALNLVIDGDACRSTAIRVPSGTVAEPRFASVEFDLPAEKVPWEERRVVGEEAWHSFAQRVKDATHSLLPERLLDAWWPTAVERGAATGRIGAGLAQSRHLAEIGWGHDNLELPQSQMCQTAAFRRFACHVFQHLPRFVDAYNAALAEFRRVHRIRNHAQPVPDLASVGPWVQAPFWIWCPADSRRRAVYIRRESTHLVLSDRRSFERSLPLTGGGDCDSAVAELGRWEQEGCKLRSRALVTTMFARLALADLFIHGIGGAKYDEATDAICQRFFGTAPPPFAAISGTLRLPVARPDVTDAELGRLRETRRALDYHPEQFLSFLEVDGQGADRKAASALATEKQRWIDLRKTPQNAAQRHEAIVSVNRRLQPFVAQQRAQLEILLTQMTEQSRANRILSSREYAFCLFPNDLLQQFLLDFSPGLL